MPAAPEMENVVVLGGQPPTATSPATRQKRAVKRKMEADEPMDVDIINVENNRNEEGTGLAQLVRLVQQLQIVINDQNKMINELNKAISDLKLEQSNKIQQLCQEIETLKQQTAKVEALATGSPG
jgi:hypothetical protein